MMYDTQTVPKETLAEKERKEGKNSEEERERNEGKDDFAQYLKKAIVAHLAFCQHQGQSVALINTPGTNIVWGEGGGQKRRKGTNQENTRRCKKKKIEQRKETRTTRKRIRVKCEEEDMN